MPGLRTRGQDQGEPSNSRSRTGLNRVESDQEQALSIETTRQNHNPDRPLGSRFSALAALALNIDIEDPGIEAKAEKETTSNPDTNSSLVVTEQARDRDLSLIHI